jgi:hypothetical protein
VLNPWRSEDLHMFKWWQWRGGALNRPDTRTVKIDSHSKHDFTGCVVHSCDGQILCPRIREQNLTWNIPRRNNPWRVTVEMKYVTNIFHIHANVAITKVHILDSSNSCILFSSQRWLWSVLLSGIWRRVVQ